MSVKYSELHGWPRELWMQEGFMAVRKLVCNWNERDLLILELGLNNGAEYPYGMLTAIPVYARPRVVKIDVEPHLGAILPEDADTQRGAYEKALLTVTYSTITVTLVKIPGRGDTLIHEKLEPAGEFITLNHNKYYWADGDGDDIVKLEANEAPGKMISRMAYTITFYNIIGDVGGFAARCKAATNHCNNKEVETITKAFAFAKHEAQYMWTNFDRVLSFDEVPTWTITQRFLIQASQAGDADWNKLWNSAIDEFAFVYEADGTTKKILVPEINFDNLVPTGGDE